MSKPTKARMRVWKTVVIWRRDHEARGMFTKVYAGQREELRLPVFVHPCDHPGCEVQQAPFGVKKQWFCRQHLPK